MNKIYDYPRLRVAAVIKKTDKFLLIEEHIKSKNNELFWGLPGGGVQFGEKLEDAVKREVKEETGLNVNVVKLLTTNENIEPEIHSFTSYFLVEPVSTELTKEVKVNDIRWFSKEEVLALNISEVFRKILSEEFYK